MANALADLLFGSESRPDAKQIPIGSGVASIGRDTADAYRHYQQYVIDAQTNGETPKSFSDWKASNG